jgi:hypothetical protein
MRRKPAEIRPEDAHIARLAWWGAFVLTLTLILGLSVVRSAQAATVPLPTLQVPGIVEVDDEEADDEGEEEEIEVEECEGADEEGEEEECEGDEVDFGPPPACSLESADAAVSADLVHDKLRLALRYTAGKTAAVAVDYFLRGSKGSLNLEGDQKHFGRNGVFRLTQDLTEAQAKKVAAAKSFTVTVDPVNAPRSCGEFLDQHLTVKRGAPGGAMWVDDDSTFRHARHARHH